MSLSSKSFFARSKILVLAALQSYQPPEDLHQPRTGTQDMRPLAEFINNTSCPPHFIDVLGAQAYVMSNETDIIVACRGTDRSGANDANADMLFRTVPYDDVGGEVHSGFYSEYSKIITGVRSAIIMHGDKEKDVWVCGHSLGGAVALLVSVDIFPTECQTFGQPRVGNKKFLENVNFPYYRWQNNNDIVTQLPLSVFGFCHAGVLKYIDAHSNVVEGAVLQRMKDVTHSILRAVCKRKWLDWRQDHRAVEYHNIIHKMDDAAE